MISAQQPSFLAHLSSDDVDHVISDLALEAEGTVLHYVIDPKELIDFCFPLNALRFRQSSASVAEVADDQIALNHLFFIEPVMPVLLDEYVYELQSTVMGIRHSFQRGANLISEITDGGRLELSSYFKGAEGEELRARAEEVIWKNLNLILAVAIGSYAEGFARLEKILRERLVSDSFPENELNLIVKAFDDNRGSGLSKAIYDRLADHIIKYTSKKEQIENYKRTAEVDACAIDRLLAINRFLEEKYARGEMGSRHLFVYLSSARRSKIIFELPEVILSLPLVKGSPYNLLRNRQQVLLKMIALDVTHEGTIDNVRKIRSLIDVKGQVYRNKVLSEGIDSSLLAAYQRKIDEHEVKIKNYGLASMLSRLERYKDLFSSQFTDRLHGMDILEDVLTDPSFPGVAEMQRSVNIALSGFKSDFRGVLLSGLTRLSETYAGAAPFLRRGRDPIIGTGHYLPTNLRMEIFDSQYVEIAELIVAFYKTPPQGDERKARLIRRACQMFLERDLRQPDVSYSHELIRTLLFLAVPGPESDSVAYQHAIEMIKLLSDKRGGKAERDFEQEFRYVSCWAARRSCLYRQAYSWADESIDIFPEDPRFYHGRSLAIFSWLKDDRSQSGRVSMRLAASDARRAIDLYRQQDPARNRDSVGALLNSLACYMCFRLDDLYDVVEARKYLNELKEWSDKLSWFPGNPEYFHTEAFVEYEEFRAMWKDGSLRDGRVVQRCRNKLIHALEEVRRGTSLYKGQEFVLLGEMIESSLRALPVG